MANYVKAGIDPESIKDTKTAQNLHTALSGESQAYLRYRWFEEKARNDGFSDVAELFSKTAENEKAHAELWFRYLGGYSATERNLESAAGGEHFEWETMYAQFAREAREEGFDRIAELFEKVGSVEKQHEQNFLKRKQMLANGSVFEDTDPETKWICLNCGYVILAKEPPAVCPLCSYPRGYFARSQNE